MSLGHVKLLWRTHLVLTCDLDAFCPMEQYRHFSTSLMRSMTYVIRERISSLSEYRSSKQRLVVLVERKQDKHWVRIASRSNTTRLGRLAADEVGRGESLFSSGSSMFFHHTEAWSTSSTLRMWWQRSQCHLAGASASANTTFRGATAKSWQFKRF